MSSSQEPLWWVAGGFALAASLVSLGQMIAHIKWNNHIKLRTYILRILLMVPVYSLEAFFGLRYVTAGLYFDVLRECYEALVIYSFFLFLVEFMGGQSAVIRMLASKAQHEHYAPCCCLTRWEMGSQFYFQIQLGTLQYVVIKPVLACITFILNNTGNYTDGLFHLDDGYIYITFINNCSQIWAMYCLILFYLVVKDELAPVKPIPKFLIVKSVVFFTFWQSVLLAILVRLDLIQSSGGLSTDNVVKGIQDFLVCIEMFFAAIAHHYAFPYDEFYDAARTTTGPRMIRSFLQAVNVTDVYVDHVRQMVRRKDHINPSEETRSENQHIELLSSNAIDSSSMAALDKSPIADDNQHSSSSPSASPKLVHRSHLKDRASNLLSPTAVDAPTIDEDDSADADLRRMTSAAANRVNLQHGTPLQTLTRASERQEAAQQYASLPVMGGSLSPNRDQSSALSGGSPASLLSVIPMSLRGKASEHAHVPLSSTEEDAEEPDDSKSRSKSKATKSKRTKPSSSAERTLISAEDSDEDDEQRADDVDDSKQDNRSSKRGKDPSAAAHKKKGRGASKPTGPLPPLSVEVKRSRGQETTSITVSGAGVGLDPSLLEPNSSRSRCSSRDTRPTDDEQDENELSRQSSGLSLHLADPDQDMEANSPQGSASEHDARGTTASLQSRDTGGWLSRKMQLGPGSDLDSRKPSRARSPETDDDEPLLENR